MIVLCAVNTSTIQFLILTMFVILELLDLLALFIPLFDLLALFDPPDLHAGASKICLPSGRPVCVCTLLLTCRNFIPA